MLLTDTGWKVHFICCPGSVFVADDHRLSKPRHQDVAVAALNDGTVTRNKTTGLLNDNAVSYVRQSTSTYHYTAYRQMHFINTHGAYKLGEMKFSEYSRFSRPSKQLFPEIAENYKKKPM